MRKVTIQSSIFGCVVVAALLFWGAGRYLVINSPTLSDTIIVLAGGDYEIRFWKAFRLLQDGYGKQLLLDENIDIRIFGFSRAELAQDFVQHIPGNGVGKVYLCPIRGDSTLEESRYVGSCVSQYGGQSILLVTSDYQTRRALSIFTHMFPQYHWSIAAAEDSSTFGKNWWERREWAKRTVTEWTKLFWWMGVDRWRI
jgi:uncharacterized SAM-binding protein YcdF (DUF218 family)